MSNPFLGSFGPVAMLGGIAIDRPTLISTEEVNDATGGTLTVPSNCDLLVVAALSRHNAVSATLNSITWNAGAMSAAVAWDQNTNRLGVGIYYVVNPAKGALTLAATYSSAPADGTIYAFYFIGNTADPIGQTGTDDSTSADRLTVTFTPETQQPVIVAAAAHSHSSGSGDGSWTGTNLTIAQQYGVAGNNSYAAGYNSSLIGAGSTGFTMINDPWGDAYFSTAVAEIRMIGV